MRLAAIALMVASVATGQAGISVLAQDAPKPKTDADLIASATSAAPAAVAKDATVVIVGADGKLRTLRPGHGMAQILAGARQTAGGKNMAWLHVEGGRGCKHRRPVCD